MKIFILILSIVFVSFLVNGQENKLSYGISSSIDIDYFYFKPYFEHYNPEKAFSSYNIGFRFQYNLRNQLSLRSGLSYSKKEITCGLYPISPSDDQYAKLKTYYLNIPLMLCFKDNFKGRFHLCPSLGISTGILLGNTEKDYSAWGIEQRSDGFLNQDLNKAILSVQISLGFEYNFGDKTYVSIEPYFGHGINKMSNELMAANSNSLGGIVSINYIIKKKNSL